MKPKYSVHQKSFTTTHQRRRTASQHDSGSCDTRLLDMNWKPDDQGVKTTYSTEVAAQTGKPHSEVMRQIRDLLKALNLCPSYFLSESFDSNGECVTSFKLRSCDPSSLYIESRMIQAILKQYTHCHQERVQDLEELLEEVEPKADFYDLMMESKVGVNLGVAAKTLGTGKMRLLSYLREHRILTRGGYKMNLPYQQYLDSGRFQVQWGSYKTQDGVRKLKPIPLITGKGLIWLTQFIKKHGRAGL